MKALSIGALVVVVLVVLLAVADRGGDFLAQRSAAGSLQESQQLDERPEVSIDGFPFLTQYFSRDFDSIEVSATDVPVGADDDGEGEVIVVDDLEVSLSGVTSDGDFSVIRAEDATAEATISYAELEDRVSLGPLGLDISYEGDGVIRLVASVSAFGQSASAEYTVTPEAVDGALAFGTPVLEEASSAAELVTEELSKAFETPIPLQGIPFDLELDDLSAEEDGIHLVLSGSDLRYDRSAGDAGQ